MKQNDRQIDRENYKIILNRWRKATERDEKRERCPTINQTQRDQEDSPGDQVRPASGAWWGGWDPAACVLGSWATPPDWWWVSPWSLGCSLHHRPPCQIRLPEKQHVFRVCLLKHDPLPQNSLKVHFEVCIILKTTSPADYFGTEMKTVVTI